MTVDGLPMLGIGVPAVIVCPRCEGQRYDQGSCGLCRNAGYLDDNAERLTLAQRVQMEAVLAQSVRMDIDVALSQAEDTLS